jgi:hypothetical protein
MRVLFVVFNDMFATREEIKSFLDNDEDVFYWQYSLPNSIFVSTKLTDDALASKLEGQFGVKPGALFLVTEISGDTSQGRLPRDSWRVINNPDDPWPRQPSKKK